MIEMITKLEKYRDGLQSISSEYTKTNSVINNLKSIDFVLGLVQGTEMSLDGSWLEIDELKDKLLKPLDYGSNQHIA
jgi:hypothetical protein